MKPIELIRTLVEMETPSGDKPACDAFARHLAALFAPLGEVTLHENATRGAHVELRCGSGDARPALILCHYDTVWPKGTIERKPFTIAGNKASGPGIFDMKSSIALTYEALRTIASMKRPVVALFTSDEEVGSPTSRALIDQRAAEAEYVLVLESPLAGGTLKLRRKGTGKFVVTVTGRAAHAGLEPEKGINALVELSHQILRISELGNAAEGTTVNVGTAAGGTASNVIPASAEAVVDVRVWTMEEAERVTTAMRNLGPVLDGASIEVTGGLNRPPMVLTTAQEAFFERARAAAASLGVDLSHGSAGGGSDANFTAALGTPTLDGLGCAGSGAHAEHEHIEIDSIEPRIALLRTLLERL